MNPGRTTSDFTSRWVSVQSSVGAYVRSAVRDAQHAEDVLQEVAKGALEQFDRYDPTRPFLHWVLGIARYRILNYYRTSRGDRHIFSESALKLIESAHIDVAPTVNERAQALTDCLEKVEGRARKVLVMRYETGVAVREIAEQLQATPNAVSRLLYRTRLLLKECIEGRLAKRGVR